MRNSLWKLVRTAVAALVGIAAIVLVLMWLMGVFHAKVASGPPQVVLRAVPGAPTITIARTESPLLESAVDVAESEDPGDFPEGAQLCNKCHTKAAIVMDGCLTCLNCGDSKCG